MGVVVHDPDMSIVYVNEAAGQILGVDPAEAMRRTVKDVRWTVFDPTGRPIAGDQVPASIVARTGQAVRGTVIGVLRSDDSMKWLVVDAIPLSSKEGWLEGVLVSFSDITRELAARIRLEAVRRSLDIWIQERDDALKSAMQALETSETQSRAVLRAMSEGVVVHGPDGAILFANPSAEKILGLSMAQMQGVLPVDPRWHLTDASGQPFPPAQIPSEITRTTGVAQRGVLIGVQRGGDLGNGWLTVNTVPIIRSGSSAPETCHMVVATFTDVTEHRRLEEAFREAQKREVLGQLAAGVAHNFNNMLAVIVPSIEMARASGSDEVRACLEDATVAAQAATDLVRRLMQLVRRESAESLVLVDTTELLDGVMHLCRRTFGSGIAIVADLPDSPCYVRARRAELQQIFVNLCINARDALGQRPDARLAVRVRREGADIVIEIEDNGCGIPPEVQKRIGEPFFTTKRQGRGTGLGLATAFSTITDFNGSLTFQSEPGVGTCFAIRLPLQESPALPVGVAEAVAQQERASRRVRALVIDDEPLVSGVIQRALEREGVEVVTAQDGDSGLDKLTSSGPFDLVLLDLSMPNRDGADVLRLIRVTHPDLPVYIMTGFLPDNVDLAQASGILTKPIEIARIYSVLREVVAIRAKQNPNR